jgi:general L-amino acid transport system permease protein
VWQVLAVAVVTAIAVWALNNYLGRGLSFSFSFLTQEASFDLAEGMEFSPSDSYGRAFLVGLLNTLKIAAVGIVLASLLGLLAGVARLSNNWLVSKIATVYVEVIRNTPLLVQLFFLYFAVILRLPRLSEVIVLPGPTLLSNRGVVFPWPRVADSFALWLVFLGITLVTIILMVGLRRRSMHRTGRPAFGVVWIFAVLVGIPAIGWLIVPGRPVIFDLPAVIARSGGVLTVDGGATLSSEFTALLLGLVIYTGAYIAEVVRSGIQAVPKGQTEAARSQGFTNGQVLRLIVLPQALRVIIPPLISQYLNLAKNSSLAIAIGFLDLYAVSQTMLNQSGRVVEVFLMIMGSYLSISLTISFVMNIVNRRMQIVER